MLAELRARGGKHRVIERTADKAAVEIDYDGQTYVESLTWEDARKSGTSTRRTERSRTTGPHRVDEGRCCGHG